MNGDKDVCDGDLLGSLMWGIGRFIEVVATHVSYAMKPVR